MSNGRGDVEARTESDRTWLAEVIVLPKPGVNDPEGEAILGGLRSLGHSGVTRVRAGRFIQVEIAAGDEDAARESAVMMCEQLLANPVIEAYEVSIGEVMAIDETEVMDRP